MSILSCCHFPPKSTKTQISVAVENSTNKDENSFHNSELVSPKRISLYIDEIRLIGVETLLPNA